MARWTLRSFAGSFRSPADVLRSLHAAMLREGLDGRFITIVYALVHIGAAEARVTVACAGHPPAVHIPHAGEPRRLAAHGDLLGIWPEVRLDQVELALLEGESLVLYTDGVTDQGPDAEGSPDHALRGRRGGPSAGALADAQLAEAARSRPVPRDDVAIVALRYLGTGGQGRDAGRRVHLEHGAGRQTSLTGGPVRA